MSTSGDPAAVLFGQTRQAILSLLFTRPDESFYLREIVRRTGRSPGAVQRELAQLTACGILARDKNKFFRANPDSPVFEPLQQLIVRTVGLADVLRNVLHRVSPQIVVAFLFGSFARGGQRAQSDVDVMIVARDRTLTVEQVAALFGHDQASLGREVNPFVLPTSEFRAKWLAGNHFLHRVLEGEKVFLIGGEDELKRLAEERLAQASPGKSARDRRSARAGRP